MDVVWTQQDVQTSRSTVASHLLRDFFEDMGIFQEKRFGKKIKGCIFLRVKRVISSNCGEFPILRRPKNGSFVVQGILP